MTDEVSARRRISIAQRTKKASPVQGEVAFAQQMTEGLSIQSLTAHPITVGTITNRLQKADEQCSSLRHSRRISPQQFRSTAVGMGIAHPPAEGSISIRRKAQKGSLV